MEWMTQDNGWWQELQQRDNEERRYEVTEVLRAYRRGLTSDEGLLVLCRETGIHLTDLELT